LNTISPGKILGWAFIVSVNLSMIILLGVVFSRFAPAKTFSVSLGNDLLDDRTLDTDASFVLQRYKPNLRKVRYRPSSPVAHGRVNYGAIELSTNAMGFRDRDHKVKKTSGTIRVAVTGDSFAFGPNLDQQHILAVELQKVLDRATAQGGGARYEVMNFGISGLNFEGMSRVTEHYALPFRPDIVLYTHICDDLSATDVTTWASWARDWNHVLQPLPVQVQDWILNRMMVGLKEIRYRFDDLRYGQQPELAARRVDQVLNYIQRLQERVPHRVMFLNFCGNNILSRAVQAREKSGAAMAALDVTDSELDHTQHPTPRANQSNSTRILSTLKMLKWPEQILADEELTPVTSDGDFLDVDCGFYHCCAVAVDGAVRCWGAGDQGTIGYPHYGQARPPLGTFVRVFSGGYSSCALTQAGQLRCWGRAAHEVPAAPILRTRDVSVGFMHICVVTEGAEINCWGDNTWGQSDAPEGSFVRVVSGGDSSCGVREDGSWLCWGGSVPAEYLPERVRSISLTDFGGCVVGETGVASCWEKNERPRAVGNWSFEQVFASRDHACGLTHEGGCHCWGRRTSEETIGLSIPLTDLSVGRDFNCGLSSEKKLMCWGDPRLRYGALDVPMRHGKADPEKVRSSPRGSR